MKPEMPDRKVTVGVAVGAVTSVVVWALNTYALEVPIPGDTAIQISVFLTFLAQYFAKNKADESS